MGTIECSRPASKSSWDSQDFGDISMVWKMAHFRKSTGPRWVKPFIALKLRYVACQVIFDLNFEMINVSGSDCARFFYYPRPVLAFGYCHRLRLWVCVCVYQSRACPHDNSSPIQARITKFGPEMQNTLVWVPIVFGDDRPWSSRSNLTWKSNFTSFWACSHHYSSAIQARITKFGPKMHLRTVKIPTNFGLDWTWSSLSFSILKPIFLPNSFAPFLYIFSDTRRL